MSPFLGTFEGKFPSNRNTVFGQQSCGRIAEAVEVFTDR